MADVVASKSGSAAEPPRTGWRSRSCPALNGGETALVEVGRELRDAGYHFVTPTPLTHARVDARPQKGSTDPTAKAGVLRDLFGWSRTVPAATVPAAILGAMRRGGIAKEIGDTLASRLRFSSLDGLLFAHSAYPTTQPDSVFFGPDTYRFADCVRRSLAGRAGETSAILDLGCGSGAGGIVAARHAGGRPFVVLADINPMALSLARVNADLAGVAAAVVAADLTTALAPSARFDLIVANPPYLVDPAHRLYRDGGGRFGEALSLRILRAGIAHLAPSGRLVLYTGSAIVGGRDLFRDAAVAMIRPLGLAGDYAEIDPDVFGEELETAPYAAAERIAAVCLTVDAD